MNDCTKCIWANKCQIKKFYNGEKLTMPKIEAKIKSRTEAELKLECDKHFHGAKWYKQVN